MVPNSRIKFLKDNWELSAIIIIALLWFIFRGILIQAFCGANICWLEPGDWPILLKAANASTQVVALVLIALFAIPFGRASIAATIAGIQLGLANGFSVFQITLLFFAATTASNLITWYGLKIFLQKPAKQTQTWLRKVQFIGKKLEWLRVRHGAFAFIAIMNALSSQIYASAIALLMGEKEKDALPALIAGSLASYFIPLLVFFTFRALTFDGISAILAALALFEIARITVAKALP
jgi:hypothetical protein